jgi:hypothetical protein
MRCWTVLLVSLACSTGAPKREGSPPAPWTVERALATIPAETMVVVVLDLPRIRASSAIKPHWTDLSEHVQRVGSPPYSEVCPALSSTTPATIVAAMSVDGEWTIWILGAPASAHRDCWVAHASQHPDAIQIEARDNVMTANVTAPRVRRTTTVLVDDQTVLVRTTTATDIPAAAATPLRSPELDWLLAKRLPFMALVHGAPPKLAALMKAEPVDSALGFETSPRIVAHIRSRLPIAEVARTIADSATAYLARLQTGGYIDKGHAGATGEVLSLEVAWEDATIVKLAQQIAPLLP